MRAIPVFDVEGLLTNERRIRWHAIEVTRSIGSETNHSSLKLYSEPSNLSSKTPEQSAARSTIPWPLVCIFVTNSTAKAQMGLYKHTGSRSLPRQAEKVSSKGVTSIVQHALKATDNPISTNRAAGPPAATASSACSALSFAAYAVFFHARRPVAAEHFWHIKEKMSTAEMGSHTRQGRKGAVFRNKYGYITPKRSGLCVCTAPVRPAPQEIDPPEAVQECQDTNAQDLPSPLSR